MNDDLLEFLNPSDLPPWDIENVLRAKRAEFVEIKDQDMRVVFRFTPGWYTPKRMMAPDEYVPIWNLRYSDVFNPYIR